MRISWPKLAVLMAMSVFGLWASSMVVVVYYALRQPLPFCPVSQGTGVVLDCNRVLSSSYSQIFGIPLELFAVIYFVVNLALVYLVAFASDLLSRASFRTLFVWRFLGVLMVPYLVFIELGILRAICVYCTMMHVAIIADFAIISYFLFYKSGMQGLIMATDPTADSVPTLTK